MDSLITAAARALAAAACDLVGVVEVHEPVPPERGVDCDAVVG